MDIVLIIPAFNEEQTIAQVISDFHTQRPDMAICVVNNNSTDQTAQIAHEALQEVACPTYLLHETTKGKASAIRKAFAEIDADVYIMVDADCTYPPESLPLLLEPILDGRADMVVGDRRQNGSYKKENKRPMHNAGNNLVTLLINKLFKAELNDILSGYRAFNKKFVKNYPVMSSGFELETELTLHALDKRFKIEEIPIVYHDRPEGSDSKLNTVSDGARVITLIFNIFRTHKPLRFFTALSLLFFVTGIVAGIYPIVDYIRHQYVYHVPLAILASGLMIISLITFAVAVILDEVAMNQRENYELRLIEWQERRG